MYSSDFSLQGETASSKVTETAHGAKPTVQVEGAWKGSLINKWRRVKGQIENEWVEVALSNTMCSKCACK